MLKWAAATFDQLGGENERTALARPVTQEMRDYTINVATPDKLKPGSWSARLYEAGKSGDQQHIETLRRDRLRHHLVHRPNRGQGQRRIQRRYLALNRRGQTLRRHPSPDGDVG